jgi:hypothetical protein
MNLNTDTFKIIALLLNGINIFQILMLVFNCHSFSHFKHDSFSDMRQLKCILTPEQEQELTGNMQAM